MLDGAAAALRPVVQTPAVLFSPPERPAALGPDVAFAPGFGEGFFQPVSGSSSPQSMMPRAATASDLPFRAESVLADQVGEPAGVPPAPSGGHYAGGGSAPSAGHGSGALGMLAVTPIPSAHVRIERRTRLVTAPTAAAPDVPVPVPE
ncbi:hypothetical protein GCM10010411_78920 [Actinomadura fulvescens]|uniref:Uncharacterized protein n=1 Tax=Actinomadura fulvescens TaxID=46160 RepID=A0ABP6CVP4_9ACTN